MPEAVRLIRVFYDNNRDDHARNFSYIWSDNAWWLSPAYDLLPSEGFGGQHTTTVNGQGNPTMNDCMTVAKEVGFPEKRATEIAEQIKKIL